MRISAINTCTPINRQNNNSNKNNTNITLKPAFGGHVEKPMILDNNGDISFYILGQDMRPLFKNERVNKKIASDEVIASFLAQNIEAKLTTNTIQHFTSQIQMKLFLMQSVKSTAI